MCFIGFLPLIAAILVAEYVDAAITTHAVGLALVVSLLLWSASILLFRFVYGQIDWFAPPVAWLGVFIFSAFSRLFIGFRIYHPAVPRYVLLVVMAVGAFVAGYFLRLHQSRQSGFVRMPLLPHIANVKALRQLAAVISFVACITMLCVNYGSVGESTVYGLGQYEQGRSYYLSIASSLLFVPSIVIYYCVWAARSKRPPLFAVILLFAYVVSMASTGDRMTALLPVLGVLITHNYALRRIRGTRLLIGAVIVLTFIVGVSAYRTSRFSLQSAGKNLSGLRLAGIAGVCLVDLGSPASVGTNVIRWFPEEREWLYGRSYRDAVFNLIPGFLFGKSLDRPFITASYLYKDLMEQGWFNPRIGYGFSLLAETFINFGYAGPPMVFLVLGYLLRIVYDRASHGRWRGAMYPTIIYVLLYLPLFVSIRADATGTLKQIVYNMAVVVIVFFLWQTVRLVNCSSPVSVRYDGYTVSCS